MTEHNLQITMKSITCYQGHVYSVPHWVHSAYYDCPMCARKSRDKLNADITHLENRIRGLKGENTKLREGG